LEFKGEKLSGDPDTFRNCFFLTFACELVSYVGPVVIVAAWMIGKEIREAGCLDDTATCIGKTFSNISSGLHSCSAKITSLCAQRRTSSFAQPDAASHENRADSTLRCVVVEHHDNSDSHPELRNLPIQAWGDQNQAQALDDNSARPGTDSFSVCGTSETAVVRIISPTAPSEPAFAPSEPAFSVADRSEVYLVHGEE
jgi:hypothetical protein